MTVIATTTRVDDDDVLRIRWAEPPQGDVVLVLRRAGASPDDGESVPVDTEPDGRSRIDLAGLELADGTWEVRLPDDEIVTTDPGFSLDGRAAYARRPRARSLHAFRAPAGGLRLEVRAVRPYAEVTAVHPDEDRLVIEGYFAFGDPRPVQQIVATRRKSEERVTGEAVTQSGRWRAELPVEPFGTILTGTERAFWDLRLDDLSVAAYLDDITKKKKKVRYPAQHVKRAKDQVRVRAYYTDKDDLAVATTIISEAAQ